MLNVAWAMWSAGETNRRNRADSVISGAGEGSITGAGKEGNTGNRQRRSIQAG